MKVLWSLLATTALVRPFALVAQASPSTPEQVVREFFRAEEYGRWLDAAHLLDLSRFEPIRHSTVRFWRTAPVMPLITPQELMKWDPDMPLAVAEYQVKKMNEHRGDFSFLSREYARVPSVDSLAALPVDEAAARWLEAKGRKWQMELSRREQPRRTPVECPSVPDSAKAALMSEWRPPVATILGATERSDSVRYVVVGRSSRPTRLARSPEVSELLPEMSANVVTLRKAKEGWRIVPTFDLPTSEGFTGSDTFFAITCKTEPPLKPGDNKR